MPDRGNKAHNGAIIYRGSCGGTASYEDGSGTTMTKAWLNQEERGSPSLMYLITWLTLNAGYTVGRVLLYPICLYFLLFLPKARQASKAYLEIVSGHQIGLFHIFCHFHVFSATILDRLFFVSGELDDYQIDLHGVEVFDDLLANNRGAVLLGAHIGSFEVLRSLARTHPNVRLKVLMHTENAQATGEVFHNLNPELARMVIPLGQPDSILKAKDFLDSGGFIGVLGDRITAGDKIIEVEFFSKLAGLPLGPHILAMALEVPVIFFCGLYHSKKHYANRVSKFYKINS